ncbi:MAG TPA: hypothetical protein PKY30_24295 [Myxococcota bacterium]|nr:hypothetical protein [Myxococcota bacterium]HNH50178.1 hypothetical protein [Myxococcota bacterium]
MSVSSWAYVALVLAPLLGCLTYLGTRKQVTIDLHFCSFHARRWEVARAAEVVGAAFSILAMVVILLLRIGETGMRIPMGLGMLFGVLGIAFADRIAPTPARGRVENGMLWIKTGKGFRDWAEPLVDSLQFQQAPEFPPAPIGNTRIQDLLKE